VIDDQLVEAQQDYSLNQSLPDIPDLSGMLPDEKVGPWENGWYGPATFVASHTFTKDSIDTVFNSGDTVSRGGDSRNIAIRTNIKRKADGKVLQACVRVNYRMSDFTQESIAAVIAHKEAQKAAKAAGTVPPEWGKLFRTFSALQQIGTLQRIAGMRQFQRTPEGGLDISPLFGKTCYARLAPDDTKPQYKQVAEFSDTPPKRSPIL